MTCFQNSIVTNNSIKTRCIWEHMSHQNYLKVTSYENDCLMHHKGYAKWNETPLHILSYWLKPTPLLSITSSFLTTFIYWLILDFSLQMLPNLWFELWFRDYNNGKKSTPLLDITVQVLIFMSSLAIMLSCANRRENNWWSTILCFAEPWYYMW